MTVTDVVPRWTLSDLARGQLEGCGITLAELFRLLSSQPVRIPGLKPGEFRVTGFGLTAVINGSEVQAVEIDGADASNWEEWARERALFRDSDTQAADDLVKALVPQTEYERRPRRSREPEIQAKVTTRYFKPIPKSTPTSRAPLAAPRPRPRVLVTSPFHQRVVEPPEVETPPVATPPPAPLRPAAAPAPRILAPEPASSDDDILMSIHPALRATVTRQVDGDYSRVVVHSSTKVTILPMED